MNLRAEFENWARLEPRAWSITRYPNNEINYAWPGHYIEYHVQCAWEAWAEAYNYQIEQQKGVQHG